MVGRCPGRVADAEALSAIMELNNLDELARECHADSAAAKLEEMRSACDPPAPPALMCLHVRPSVHALSP